jgi:hypothetical protein
VETSHLLKGEINETLKSLHDFAKWKLIVTSALAAAAFGLTSAGVLSRYWILLLIPYACAYIDLNCYQYLIRITVISRSLRNASKTDEDLARYETLCGELRKRGVFSLGEYAEVTVSLAISLVAPLFEIFQSQFDKKPLETGLAAVLWLIGVLSSIGLWLFYKIKNKTAETEKVVYKGMEL